MKRVRLPGTLNNKDDVYLNSNEAYSNIPYTARTNTDIEVSKATGDANKNGCHREHHCGEQLCHDLEDKVRISTHVEGDPSDVFYEPASDDGLSNVCVCVCVCVCMCVFVVVCVCWRGYK